MFGASVGNLFKTGDKAREPVEVREGGIYRRRGPGDLTETAKVLHVGPDAMGITHVRYQLMVESACEQPTKFEDSRTLNIETFLSRFSEAGDA